MKNLKFKITIFVLSLNIENSSHSLNSIAPESISHSEEIFKLKKDTCEYQKLSEFSKIMIISEIEVHNAKNFKSLDINFCKRFIEIAHVLDLKIEKNKKIFKELTQTDLDFNSCNDQGEHNL
jgi:hypothetical protein